VLSAPDDPRLPDGSVDIIFFCDVLHHIENRAAYYPKLAKALKPGGRIAVIEFYKKEMPIFEDRATVVRPAQLGCTVEVAVGGLNQYVPGALCRPCR
jgi:SAM-dependent methyltransferase